MALLTVHLLVAHRWAQEHPEFVLCPEFYLGAISPDAIHVRDKEDKSRKDYFHLGNWKSPHLDRVYEYWRTYRSPFDIGYGVHVLTDAQWVPRFCKIRELFPDGKHMDKKRYYNDTFLTDFALYERDGLAKSLYALVAEASVPTTHPLLWEHEIAHWRSITLKTYSGSCPMSGTQKYIDVPYVDAFVEESVPLLEQAWYHSFA